MILEIQHETRLHYNRPVTEWVSEFRVEPCSDADQSLVRFHLSTGHPVPVQQYRDGFGNKVHHFNLLWPTQEVWVLAAGIVETHPREVDLEGSRASIAEGQATMPLDSVDDLRFRGPVRNSAALMAIAAETTVTPATMAALYARYVATMIYTRFEYAKEYTQASSPIDDVLALGKGVCQDFAHLMLGLLRLAGIPSRYVSGYIHRPGKESQSHAWVEVWIADRGWVGIDPTNDIVVNDHFVKVAVGRDFTDVQPNRGVYRGTGEEQMHARVQTRELDRLPTLTWREQLPKLDSPLVEILPPAIPPEHLDDADAEIAMASQQQQ